MIVQFTFQVTAASPPGPKLFTFEVRAAPPPWFFVFQVQAA